MNSKIDAKVLYIYKYLMRINENICRGKNIKIY